MAYVIAICGAGGKTTLCFEKANYYLSKGLSVAVTTTTHMANENFITKYEDIDFDNINNSKLYFVANVDGNKVCSLSDNQYNMLCDNFDIVIVEADGSRSMPMKIIDPSVLNEPVIPDNVDEIIIVMGRQAIGRELHTICHRIDKYAYRLEEIKNQNVNENTIVTEELLIDFAKVYYADYLKKRFPNAKFEIFLSDMTKNDNYKKYKNISFVVSASGFSKRFGPNKLFYKINGIEIYKIVANNCLEAIEMLKNYDIFKNIDFDMAYITQYDIDLTEFKSKYLKDGIKVIKNDNPQVGMSNSVKIATNKYIESDAICYFNADMPYIKSKSIANMIYYFVCSNKNIGAMCVDKILKNPAIFSKIYYREILDIQGDTGPRELLKKYDYDCYYYHIDKKEMIDIDTTDDIII